MAISRKPKPQQDADAEQVDVDALIARGGSSPQAPAQPSPSAPGDQGAAKETTSFTLRVPRDILATLDDHLKQRPYKMPRQQWILEAIVQRLEREAQAD